MTEQELKLLKELPVPPSRPAAREAAVQASLAAFAGEAQGNETFVRRREVLSRERRFSMRQSFPKYAVAASVAVLAIAVPATLYQIQNSRPARTPMSGPATVPSAPPEQKAAEPAPPPPPAKPQPLARVESSKAPGHAASPVPPARLDALRSLSVEAGRARDNYAVSQATPGVAAERAAEHYRQQGILPDRKAEEGRDRFQSFASNPVKRVGEDPVSTFSIDADTSSYSFVRRALMAGRLPPKDAVRVEEMINYFPYDYAPPKDRAAPFVPTVTVMPAPWNADKRLMHVAIKGYDVARSERPRANLVFLIDVSGSMAPEDRLPLLKSSLRLLVDTLKPDDTIGIVTYAGQARAALEPTKVADKSKILNAIEQLQAGGSTAGASGIETAYGMAEASFDKAAVNRIVLGTDGDFNVGISDTEQLKSYVERKRQSGIFLSILGFGRGNFNDTLMQALAQNGNGTAAYIDTLNEGRKVLAEEASSTLFPIAKDVKIQVEFNPATVSEYRLIGYETRALRREDFNNDKVDAGEVGSGHAVTAIYELTPAGAPSSADPLRYQQAKTEVRQAPLNNQELGFVKVRYKLPSEDTSRLIELPVRAADGVSVDQASADVRFSTAVAAFGQLLRSEPHLGRFSYDDVIALANAAKGADAFGYRAEFVNLARLAKSVRP